MPSAAQIKKNVKGSYDPQVGAAAQATAKLAERAQMFTEDYYTRYITPLLQQQGQLASEANERESKQFDMNMGLMKQANERYQKYGIPAEDRYYKMVDEYSSEDRQNQEAEAALGDQKTQAAVQQQDSYRRMASMGIDPTSPAAQSAMLDFNVQQSALGAAASTRARAAAKQLGMQLTSDAANFGRGGTSSILQFGAAASGNTTNGLNATGSALAGANSGASVPMAGYGLGVQAQSGIMNTYAGLNKASMEAKAQNAAGLGSLVGTGLGLAFSDRVLKKNISKLATLPNGIGVYEFNYLWEPNGHPRMVGFMADEVEAVCPDAVAIDASGFKKVDYSKVAI